MLDADGNYRLGQLPSYLHGLPFGPDTDDGSEDSDDDFSRLSLGPRVHAPP